MLAVSRSDDAPAGVQSASDSQRESQAGGRWFPVHRGPAPPPAAAAQQR